MAVGRKLDGIAFFLAVTQILSVHQQTCSNKNVVTFWNQIQQNNIFFQSKISIFIAQVQRIYFMFELLSIAPLSGRLMNTFCGISIVDVLLQISPLQKWECISHWP